MGSGGGLPVCTGSCLTQDVHLCGVKNKISVTAWPGLGSQLCHLPLGALSPLISLCPELPHLEPGYDLSALLKGWAGG